MIKNKRWLLPLVLLLVIVAASGLRWNQEATKTIDDGVIKWERDRWTGDLWLKGYTIGGSGVKLALRPSEWTEEKNDSAHSLMVALSRTRDILAGGMIFWMALELLREYRKKEKVKAGESA